MLLVYRKIIASLFLLNMVEAGVAERRIWNKGREWFYLLKDLQMLIVVNGMCHHSSQQASSVFGFHSTLRGLARYFLVL